MCVYHDRFYQNNEVYKFKDKLIFISNWVGCPNDIRRVHTFCQRHILQRLDIELLQLPVLTSIANN